MQRPWVKTVSDTKKTIFCRFVIEQRNACHQVLTWLRQRYYPTHICDLSRELVGPQTHAPLAHRGINFGKRVLRGVESKSIPAE
jgi:hypothetical protein